MKKILLLILFIIFTLTSINAQKKILIGVKGGVNIININSDNYFMDSNSKTGFYLGLLSEIPFGDIFSIQPEILYSSQGSKANLLLIGGGPWVGDYSLKYIQAPILAKIYIFNKISVEIGPSFNFLVDGKEKINSISRNDLGKTFEFSGALGVSYKLKERFSINTRYVHGLSAAFDRGGNYSEDAKNSGFQFGVGFIF